MVEGPPVPGCDDPASIEAGNKSDQRQPQVTNKAKS